MNLAEQIAKHMRGVYFGGNWTTVNLRDTLSDVTWEQATTQVSSFNTILTLTCHVSYYVKVVSKVLRGGPLEARDEYSFQHPPIHSREEWESLLEGIWADAETFVALIERLPENIFGENFTDEKYGSYYRNLHGIVEHTHYHLGQIVLMKKLLAGMENEPV